MIGLAAAYNDAPTANNTTFQLDFPFDWRQDLVRVDYRFSASQASTCATCTTSTT